MAMTFQMLMRGVDGRTSCLGFSSSTIAGSFLQEHVATILRIPAEALLIVTGTRVIHPHTFLCAGSDGFFPSCSLLLRLRGGKGGFGSLLRGAATKAGQKKTSNFDACRDMSGRRLRHVNAEKKLKEWKAQAKERELEKAANEFLKKQVKQKEDESGCFQVIERFREETSRAREDVESAVAQGLFEAKKFGKRKIVDDSLPSTSSKRAHIFEIDTIEEDSEDEREGFEDEDAGAEVDSEEGNEDEDAEEGSEDEDMEKIFEDEDLEKGSEDENHKAGSEDDKVEQGSEAAKVERRLVDEDMEKSSKDENHKAGSEDDKVEQGSEAAKVEGRFVDEDAKVRSEEEKAEEKFKCEKDEETIEEKHLCNGLDNGHVAMNMPMVEVAMGNGNRTSSISVSADVDLQKQHSRTFEEKIGMGTDVLSICGENTCNENKPSNTSFVNVEMKDLLMQSKLDLGDYLHASDLEVLGLERLKQELQVRGLKCGGSLAERAGRLFLLKTVPLEKLDKKHFTKARV